MDLDQLPEPSQDSGPRANELPNIVKTGSLESNRPSTGDPGHYHLLAADEKKKENRPPDADGEHPKKIESGEVDIVLTCGWGSYRPDCVQVFNNPKAVLFFLCAFACIQGMMINGFINVSVTSLETRFQFSSVLAGLIVSFYDIAVMLCLLLVTYYGEHGHKPQWLGWGCIVMGVGSLVFTLPHFTTGLYNYQALDDLGLCTNNDTMTEDCNLTGLDSNLQAYVGVFIVAQLLTGAGATPLYTLGITFLDENVRPKLVPLYIGIFYALSILGPAIGYLIGGQFIQIWTDIDQVDQSSITLTSDDQLWVGAWWIGMLLCAGLAFLLGIPILGYPKELPGAAQARAERVIETHQSGNKHSEQVVKSDFGKSLKDLPVSLHLLLTNLPFIFICLAQAMEWSIASALAAFSPKYIEQQFGQSKSWAATLSGFVAIPAGVLGNVIGGYIQKKFELSVNSTLKMCTVIVILATLFVPSFFIQCPDIEFAGINTHYWNSSPMADLDLESSCNSDCVCSSSFNPVCGSDEVTYFSACYAGCTLFNSSSQVYMDCSCVANTTDPSLVSLGQCESNCTWRMPVFLFLVFFIITISFLQSVPAVSATLRTVSENQRSFAIGVQWIIIRLLGTIPGPIIFGAVIDEACVLWEVTCDGSPGSCLFYDNTMIGVYCFSVIICESLLAVLFFILALITYKPPSKVEVKRRDSLILTGYNSFGVELEG